MPLSFERQKFFWSRVRREGEHLIWIGARHPRGYGKLEIEGETVYAHRFAYCIAHDCDPRGIDHLTILRTCDRNDCVEPTHLVAKPKRRK